MSDSKTNAVATTDGQQITTKDNSQMAAALIYGGTAMSYFCSMPDDYPNRDEILTKCAFSPDGTLAECVGKTITVAHLYGIKVNIVNQQTSEVDEVVHTVLIDTDGLTWACTSKGIAKSIALLLQSKGHPASWPAPVAVEVIRIKAKLGYMFALKVVATPPAKSTKK